MKKSNKPQMLLFVSTGGAVSLQTFVCDGEYSYDNDMLKFTFEGRDYTYGGGKVVHSIKYGDWPDEE